MSSSSSSSRLHGWLAAAVLLLCAQLARAYRDSAFIGYTEKQSVVTIKSAVGDINIKLLSSQAPAATKLVYELAKSNGCQSCKFYRHEPVPANWGKDEFWGPPYSLLQGGMYELAEVPPREQSALTVIRKGDACFIPGSKDFFIATEFHQEWGNSHVVWGQVDDLTTVLKFPVEPFFTRSDDNGKIITRWLNESYPFTIEVAPPRKD